MSDDKRKPSPPEDLVGAQQGVVHEKPAAVRAGLSAMSDDKERRPRFGAVMTAEELSLSELKALFRDRSKRFDDVVAFIQRERAAAREQALEEAATVAATGSNCDRDCARRIRALKVEDSSMSAASPARTRHRLASQSTRGEAVDTETLTVAAARVGLSTRTLQRLIASGRLPVVRINARVVRLRKEDVDAIFSRQ